MHRVLQYFARIEAARDREADRFVKDMRKAREEVPGATQEIPVVKSPAHLEKMTRDELREEAARLRVKGRGSMNKEQLIQAIKETEL